MQIADNKVVSIHYTLKNPAGEVIDSSEGNDPLMYLHGASNIIPGLEKELLGKQAGDKLNVTVQPDEGYGQVHQEMVQEVPRDAFQGVDDIQVGQRFEAESNQGPISVVVTAVTDDTVTVDGNHPLAGIVLDFDVEVVDVRDASEEEVSHGHPHGPEGHAH